MAPHDRSGAKTLRKGVVIFAAPGAFDWVMRDQVQAFITELLRPIGTHLYGRRLYETMACGDAPVES